MKNVKNVKNVIKFKKLAAVFAAAAMITAAFAGCSSDGDSSGSSDSSDSSSSKYIEAQLDYAKGKISDYTSSENILSADFAADSFNKAEAAILMADEKTSAEDFEKVAKYLSADTIVFTDADGTITACYPEDNKGKAIKDVKELAPFNRLVKGIVIKVKTDPEPVEGTDTYSLYAGVMRPEGAGTVIVGYKTNEYNTVTGADLADKCGANTIVLREGTIISSTLPKAEAGSSLDSIGVSDDDIKSGDFSMTVDGKDYECKAEAVDDFVVICASPK